MIKGKSTDRFSKTTKTYNCPYCQDTGLILEKRIDSVTYGEPNELEYAVTCPHCGGIAARAEGFQKLSHMPLVFCKDDLSNIDWDIYTDDKGKKIDISDVKELIELFVEHFMDKDGEGEGLYFYSKSRGSGKTYLATCLANTLMNKYGISAKFVSASELIALDKKEDDQIEGLCTCRLLILDDLGAVKSAADWNNSIIFRIIDSRLNSRLSTVITSNCTIEKLPVDTRIIDRIFSIALEIHLPEVSIRLQKSRQAHVDLIRKWKSEKKKDEVII